MAKIMRTERVEQKIVVQTQCDICKKLAEGDGPDGWLSLSSGHSEWGNDSVDSMDHHDVCSYACCMTAVREVFDRFGEYESLYMDVGSLDQRFLKDMLESVDGGDRG